jgi:hypothetical protein
MNPGEPKAETLRCGKRKGPPLRSPGPALSVSLLLLAAGCGGTLYLAANGRSPRPPVEVFDCVKGQVPVLGYTQTSIDVEDHRITARRYDKEARYADSRFRRMIDRLTVEVAGSAEGGAVLKVGAHTFAELATQRGPTEIEQEASPAVKEAARKLLDECGR